MVVTKLGLEKTDPRLGKRNVSLSQTRSSRQETIAVREANQVIQSTGTNKF